MEREEIERFVKKALVVWEKSRDAYCSNLPKYGKKARALNPDIVSGGKIYNDKARAKAFERSAKYLSYGAVMLSTISELHLTGIPLQSEMTSDMRSVWPSEEVLMNCGGMTMVVCPDGKAVLMYDGKKVKVVESDEHKADLVAREGVLVAGGATAEDAHKTVQAEDLDMNGMFGGQHHVIQGVNIAGPVDPASVDRMNENAITAKIASEQWAQILEVRDKDRRITSKDIRNGIPAIAWKKKKEEAIKAFGEEIASQLNGGTSIIYSTDKEFNNIEATSTVDAVRRSMRQGGKHVSMMVERGKVTIFSNGLGERVIYQSDESKAREASAGASSGDPD